MDKTERKNKLVDDLKLKIDEQKSIIENVKARHIAELQVEQEKIDGFQLQLDAIKDFKIK